MIVVVVIGILLSIVANRLPGLGNELENATRETTSFLRLVRAEASVTTSAYRIVVASETTLRTEFARSCVGVPDADWEPDGNRNLVLRDGVVFAGTEAQVGNVLLCFNPRGVANRSPRMTIRDREGGERQVEALIGGGVIVTSGSESTEEAG